jgi:hypothetical protein
MDKAKLTLDEILDIVLPMIKQGDVIVPRFKDWVSYVRREIRRDPFYKTDWHKPWTGDSDDQ